MTIKFNKIKILKKFNAYTLYGFTTKFNLYYKYNKKFNIYKVIKHIQILKLLYNLKHKKLKIYLEFNIYKLIKLLKLLKSRIDSVLFDSNLFLTLNNIRQHVSHKHILLNNKIIKNSSYIIKSSDILHIIKLDIKLILNTLIYNYLIKNLKSTMLYNKIYRLFKYRSYIKNILLYHDYTLFNYSICYKDLKLKININKSLYSSINTDILNL
uniref:Ribosomal protein S4 n=1 Tax=Babesia motasi TaxID=237580 RepID=A0A411AD67_9APIC|nr:ribosomal protein S4 [Babesia motasi]QAX27056.1 ribosomal protein S4 [Babesia motasi]